LTRFAPAIKKSVSGRTEGLLSFRQNGAWFSQAFTAGAPTVTAAGHASICSGSNPSNHGIVGNEIFDKVKQRGVASTLDEGAEILRTPGILPSDPLARAPSEGVSGRRMKNSTLADVLFKWSGGKSKSVAVSIKDRGAVYCGGQSPAGVYWYDYKSGSMVGSSAYAKTLPDWVNQFNRNRQPDLGFVWKPLLSTDEMRQSLSSEAERKSFTVRSPLSQWLGDGFPYKPKKEDSSGIGARQFFQYTPAAVDYLFDFALESIRRERLGCHSRNEAEPCKSPRHPDLLTLSVSTPDLVGHAFGPESPEVMDIYLNLNKSVERFKASLSHSLGADQVLFVISSDHGVQSLPEVRLSQGASSGRMIVKELQSSLEKALAQAWGEGPWIQALITGEIHFKRESFEKQKKSLSDAVALLREHVKSIPGARGLVSRDEILKAGTPELDLYRRGHDPERSGDAVVLLQSGWVQDSRNAANHGTAFDEDSRIPILFSGWQIRQGVEVTEIARADDIAPTVLGLLGIEKAPFMTGRSFSGAILKNKK
jgi:predicted AlkP superfamily pyrophosphatase or phosphodiesterase